MKNYKLKIDFWFDAKFWALIPALNINFHSLSLEFEFLCFGIYVDFI